MKKVIFVFCLFLVAASSTVSFAEGDYIKLLTRYTKDDTGLISTTYIVYLDTDIRDPNNYRELFYLLALAKQQDIIIIKINTYGGDAWTAVQIYNELKKCRAKTIAEIYIAYSAGSIVAMACKEIKVMKFSSMMIHNIQAGFRGDISNIKKQTTFFGKLNRNLITSVFKNFLTKAEIDFVVGGGALWLTEEDMKAKLRNKK